MEPDQNAVLQDLALKYPLLINPFDKQELKREKERMRMRPDPRDVLNLAMPYAHAQGNVAVIGIGSGYAPLKLASNPNVDKVTVFDADERYFRNWTRADGWRREFEKIEFARGWHDTIRGYNFDLLFVDGYYRGRDDEDYLSDIGALTSENLIGEYWPRGIELVALAALRQEIVSVYDLHDMMKLLFIHWINAGAPTVPSIPEDERDRIINVLNAMSESGSSTYFDLILEE